MRTVFYYLALACLFTHELDAVAHSEWRLLFVLQRLPDATALPWFVVLLVPLFFGILYLSQHRRTSLRKATRLVVATFCVVHAALHLALASNPKNEFHGSLSHALFLSAAAFGAAFLIGELLRHRSTSRSDAAGG